MERVRRMIRKFSYKARPFVAMVSVDDGAGTEAGEYLAKADNDVHP